MLRHIVRSGVISHIEIVVRSAERKYIRTDSLGISSLGKQPCLKGSNEKSMLESLKLDEQRETDERMKHNKI